ncbi:MAG: DNA-3-methyladenine glycosylase I [Firmicutes bacterium]|nr:DNA-3-methyladenine glycosylase I [Bacillota bacterium]
MREINKRCVWCNVNNPVYVDYHDNEWGVPCHDDHALFELLILEGFQAGLSWETILNKRENFRAAFDGFDLDKVAGYGQEKIDELLQDKGIVRNRRKVNAAVKNANVFKEIQSEFGSFSDYIWGWTNGEIIYENDKVTSELSDKISKDLKKRGMTFVGSTIIYSYLQATGVINSHEDGCYKYKKHESV